MQKRRWVYISFLFVLCIMVQERGTRGWVVANLSLGIISFLLLLHLFNVPAVLAGKAYEAITPGDAFCAVQWGEEKTVFNDIDRCCVFARTQLSCERRAGRVGDVSIEWDCYTGRGKGVHYLLNQKAYRYCQNVPIGVD